MIEFQPNKFFVVNRKHLDKIPGYKCALVSFALRCIADYVPENRYYVCNQDEPYADKVIATILAGELAKEESDKT